MPKKQVKKTYCQHNNKEILPDKSTSNNANHNDRENVPIQPKFGPALSFPYQKIWSRCILISGLFLIVWFNSKQGKEIIFAKQHDTFLSRSQHLQCAPDYTNELKIYPGCLPEKCGRIVTDNLISSQETDTLLQIAKNAMNLGGSDGGATIFDLHTGALSKGTKFINVYALKQASSIFNSTDFNIYKIIKTKIHHAVAHHFGVDADKIFLTKPTFFSRMTNTPAKTIHDNILANSHTHYLQNTYEHFHYTSLLYLNDFGRDFDGGRFIFIDKNNVNTTIEPRKGRVSIFTSGAENLHLVERVNTGTRYALTVSFTCNINASISDPSY
ncbi:hypothetical protein PV325_006292 [Microctonus aethiopoides]|nr:hypothetical protein PV325_006292 [Microctonus aethiopoides]